MRVSVAVVATVLDYLYIYIYIYFIYLWYILVIQCIWLLAVGESIRNDIKIVLGGCLWYVWDKPIILIFACSLLGKLTRNLVGFVGTGSRAQIRTVHIGKTGEFRM